MVGRQPEALLISPEVLTSAAPLGQHHQRQPACQQQGDVSQQPADGDAGGW
jgi:hypothetical protein